MNPELRRRGIYLLPNLLTTAGLFSGFYAIVQAMTGRFEHAAVAIFIAMVFDGLDGRVARMTRTQSAFRRRIRFAFRYGFLRRGSGADRLRVGDEGHGQVGLDRRVCLLRRSRCAWPGSIPISASWISAISRACPARLRQPWWQASSGSSTTSTFRAKMCAGMPSPDAFCGITMVSTLRYWSGKDINLRRSVPFMVLPAIVLGYVLVSSYPPGSPVRLVPCLCPVGLCDGGMELAQQAACRQNCVARKE
jgi:CDP-diacylglycerol--serine O-phosphatidyltransferase